MKFDDAGDQDTKTADLRATMPAKFSLLTGMHNEILQSKAMYGGMDILQNMCAIGVFGVGITGKDGVVVNRKLTRTLKTLENAAF